jgi:GT2 family glycosyltransferase
MAFGEEATRDPWSEGARSEAAVRKGLKGATSIREYAQDGRMPCDRTVVAAEGAAPFISVVMPVRNEAKFIQGSLESVLRQEYPQDRVEVIVADGMSTDGTREVIRKIQAAHPNVRMIDNPEGIAPTGLNRAILEAKGEIVVRMDGHALFEKDFLKENVRVLSEHPEAWSAGGPIVHTARTTFGKAVAAAMAHPLGVGNAAHRFATYEGYAEGTAFPAFRKWVFSKIGFFDERLVRNQDDEFNYRINRAGGKTYITPRVRYRYFVRERPGQLFRQYFQYAFWRIPVISKHRRPTSARQIIPSLFLLSVLCDFAAGMYLRNPIIALFLPVCYAASLLTTGMTMLPMYGWKVTLRIPYAMAVMHAAYALGMFYGLISGVLNRRAWEPSGQMARISR